MPGCTRDGSWPKLPPNARLGAFRIYRYVKEFAAPFARSWRCWREHRAPGPPARLWPTPMRISAPHIDALDGALTAPPGREMAGYMAESFGHVLRMAVVQHGVVAACVERTRPEPWPILGSASLQRPGRGIGCQARSACTSRDIFTGSELSTLSDSSARIGLRANKNAD